MAKREEQKNQVSGYTLNSTEGWLKVRAMEDDNAVSGESRFNNQVVQYDIMPNSKGAEVTVVVFVPGTMTARKAEWQGFLTVKRRHASIWGESKMAMPVEGGHNVYVRWMIWNNSASPEPSQDVSF